MTTRRLGETAVAQVQAALVGFQGMSGMPDSLARTSIRAALLAHGMTMGRYARELRKPPG